MSETDYLSVCCHILQQPLQFTLQTLAILQQAGNFTNISDISGTAD
jgi:hypothetical protein